MHKADSSQKWIKKHLKRKERNWIWGESTEKRTRQRAMHTQSDDNLSAVNDNNNNIDIPSTAHTYTDTQASSTFMYNNNSIKSAP